MGLFTNPVAAVTGIVGTALSLLPVIPSGMIGAISIQATLEETHHSTVEVTDHPVQQGAQITDHSFVRPSEVTLKCGWSNSSGQALLNTALSLFTGGSAGAADYVTGIYSQLQRLMQARLPFNIVTSLRLYNNMLITSMTVTRDEKTSQALMITVACREVIIVSTQQVLATDQALPQTTQALSQATTIPLPPSDAITTFTPLPGVNYSP